MPDARSGERLLTRAQLRELLDVGAGREDVWLSGEHHRDPVAALELLDDSECGRERAAPEHRRLRVIRAVVHRHERERAEAGLDSVELELGVHCTFSQSTAAPIPIPMQSAVRP